MSKTSCRWKKPASGEVKTHTHTHTHTNAGKNTLERNRKSNDIHFELSNRFSPLHIDDQNLTTKRLTSAIPNIPEKLPTNIINTSPHATNTVRNKRRLICTIESYLKNFIPLTVRGNSGYASIFKTAVKFSLWVIVM